MSEPAATDPLIGLAIHDYVIREKLAEGGMGKVYLAAHLRLPKQVVIKVLLGDYANHPIIRGRFEREALAAAKLKHRYIIEIANFGVLPDGQLFLMMPFLEGRSLDAHLRHHGGKLNIYETTHIIEQVLVALQHMHDNGIVHRDLKPGNIFITRAEDIGWKVTLIDLGIVRDVAVEASTVKTDTGISIGTPGYMSPEQYGDAANAGPAADLYAVGIMLWEMLTGGRPWSAPNTNMLFHLQVTTVPELPPGVEMSPDLLALIRKTLAKEPDRRPQRARDLGIALASLVPAIPPFVPSGAQILKDVAPEFTKQASPYDGTLRNQGGADHPTPAASSWTPPATHIPALPTGTPRSPFEVAQPDSAPVAAPTVSQRPAAAFAAPFATPVAPAPALDDRFARPSDAREKLRSSSSLTAGKMLAIGLVCALVVGVTTFLIASSRHHVSAPSAPLDAHGQAAEIPARAASAPVDAGTTAAVLDATAVQVDATPSRPRGPAVVPSPQHVRHGDHATGSRDAAVRVPTAGSTAPATGSASTGSATAPTTPKKLDPDAIEE